MKCVLCRRRKFLCLSIRVDKVIKYLSIIFCLYNRTELCAFSEYRIYPGHGIRYIRRDGQVIADKRELECIYFRQWNS